MGNTVPPRLAVMLALEVARAAPPLRYVFQLPCADGNMSHATTGADGDVRMVNLVSNVNVTVLAAGSDVLGGEPLNVSVAGLWGPAGSVCRESGACSHGGKVLLGREEGVLLRGEGSALESLRAIAARRSAEPGDGCSGAGRCVGNEEAGLRGWDGCAAATEELFCRKVEIGLEVLMPQWLAFLWSEEWGSVKTGWEEGEEGGLGPVGMDGSNGAYWERVGADEWAPRHGGARLNNVLVSESGGYLLGPLRVLEVDPGGGAGAAAFHVSFHVRSATAAGETAGGVGGAGGHGETMDWLVVRAVGRDAVVPGSVRRVAPGQYHVSLVIPRHACGMGGDGCVDTSANVYVLQMVKAWEGLPVWLGERDGEEVETCDAVLGHVGVQVDVIAQQQLTTSFIGHVLVPAISSKGSDGSAHESMTRGGLPVCDSEGFWGTPSGGGSKGGLRQGAWVRRGFYDAAPRLSGSSERRAPGQTQPRDGASAAGVESVPGVVEDECHLVGGNWEWQPEECVQQRFSERDCEACWLSFERVRFVGDSNCRDIYVEAATCVLGDWDPDLNVARQQTKHSNASLPLPSGGAFDFLWCTHLEQVTAGAEELLREVQERLRGDQAGGARETVLVMGFGIWDLVVHLTPLSAMAAKLEPLFDAVAGLQELGVAGEEWWRADGQNEKARARRSRLGAGDRVETGRGERGRCMHHHIFT